uniref:Uncharacterized protein n=1 Tax=Glossina brevipalpis TaxID=37001 RepID=A0A1A9W329_9MUSC
MDHHHLFSFYCWRFYMLQITSPMCVLMCNSKKNNNTKHDNNVMQTTSYYNLFKKQAYSRPSSTKSGFLGCGLLSSELGGAVVPSVSLAPAAVGKDPGNPPGKPPTPPGNEFLNTSIIFASLGFDLYFSILAGFLIISCRAAITSGSFMLDNRSIKLEPPGNPPGIPALSCFSCCCCDASLRAF